MQCWIKIKRRKKENLYIIMCFCVMWVCVMRLFSEEIELIMYVFVCRCIRCLSNVTVIIYFKQYTTDLSSRLSRRDMLYSFRYSKVHKRIRNLKFCCIKLLDATIYQWQFDNFCKSIAAKYSKYGELVTLEENISNHLIKWINDRNIRYKLEKFSCLKLYRYYDLRVKRILTICEHSFLVFIKLFSREVSKREDTTLNLATSLLSLMIWLIHFRVWQLERVFVWYLI